MVQSSRPSIRIDLNEFKLHLHLKDRAQLTLHFDSPSRRFYLSVIALVVNGMKRFGKIKSISLQEHFDLLVLLNESIGGSAGSSEKEILLHRIYRKWKDALPNLEEAPLFAVLGKKKEVGEDAIGRIYSFTDVEKDEWANLFEYKGSEENVGLKFAIDRIGATLDDVVIVYEDCLNADAWEKFISTLKEKEEEPDKSIPEEPEVAAPPYPGEVASIEKMAFPLPDKPSIAVLPFVNMSEDPKQEFLCDGMTEAIITALSKLARLFVVAKDSTFTYKGKRVKVKQISEELGARYVLEGSLQRSGDRVRVTAQLIDALTGDHLWAEHYDRDLKDIFALQDEITAEILVAMRLKLTEGEQALKFGIPRRKERLDYYLKIVEGFKAYEGYNIEANTVAGRIAEEAIAMCPEEPLAYVLMSWVYLSEYSLRIGKSPDESLEKAIKMAKKALAIDDSIPFVHATLCALYVRKSEYEKAVSEGERAVALDPGGAFAHEWYGASLHYAGRPQEAIPVFQKAVRLNPFGPAGMYYNYGDTLLTTGRYEEAVSAYKKALQRSPNFILVHINLAATYNFMGREKEARAEAEEVLRLNPKFSLEDYAKIVARKNLPGLDRYIDALRKAGLK